MASVAQSAMKITTVELEQMRDDLLSLEQEIEALMALLPERGRLIFDEQREAQRRLKELKDRLHKEARREFTRAQDLMYAPHVQQAAANLNLRVNSVPDHRWMHKLYDAKFTIGHARFGLDKQLEGRHCKSLA